MDCALAHPETGLRTIAAALWAGHSVGQSAVYGTFQRRGSVMPAKRLAAVRRRAGQTEPDEVERNRALSKQRHLRALEPGHIVCADTALVGWLKEAGIVHMAVAIDGHSSYDTAVSAPARNAELAASAAGVPRTGRVLTGNGTEVVFKAPRAFEALCARLGAKQSRRSATWLSQRQVGTVRADSQGQTAGDVAEKHCLTIQGVQADPDRRLAWYNTQRFITTVTIRRGCRSVSFAGSTPGRN